jgi:hypothetical protein
MRPRLRGALVALALSGPVPPLRAAQPQQQGMEEAILQLQFGRLATATVVALKRDEVAYLPVGRLLNVGEVEFGIDTAGVLAATWEPGSIAVRLDPASDVATVDGRPVAYPSGSVVWSGGELYASSAPLELVLGVRVNVDWTELTAQITNPEVFPLALRLEREARRQAVIDSWETPPPALSLSPSRPPFDGFVADWSTLYSLEDPAGTAAYRVGVGAAVLGGAFQATAQSAGPLARGGSRVDATYLQVWRDQPWLRQLRLGDMFASGPRPRGLRGVSLTNTPFVRPHAFGTTPFVGTAGPGWDIEVRQSGRTIDFSQADEQGSFALDIPIGYGENPIQVVAFGPHGQVVTADHLVEVGFNRLPGGTFEYGASLGDCRSALCEATANLDLHYGVSDRLTIRSGVEQFWRDSLPDLFHPYIGAAAGLTPAWQVSAQVVADGFARGIVSYSRSVNLRARGSHTEFVGTPVEPIFTDRRRARTLEADLFWRMPGILRDAYLELGAVHEVLRTGTRSRFLANQALQFDDARLNVGARLLRQSSEDFSQTDLFPFTGITAMARVFGSRPLWIRAEVESRNASELWRISGQVARQFTQELRLELGAQWFAAGGTVLTLALTANLPFAQAISQSDYATDRRSLSTQQYLQGTVQWDRVGNRLAFGYLPGLQRGGVAGTVFLDENANGVRDAGEPALAGVDVYAGLYGARTDSSGFYGIWDLVPFELERLRVDSLSIANPLWVPLYPEVELPITPASYRQIDVPIVVAGEVSGRVVVRREDGSEFGFGPIALALVNAKDGQRIEFESFSDGEFYLFGIHPGEYRLEVEEELLSRYQLRPSGEPLAVSLPATPDGPRVEGLIVLLVPTP